MTPERANNGRGQTSERVFARLEREILSRARPPGTRLVAEQLARELGVSRTPVREALRLLQRAGWVDAQPNAGATVRQPSIEEVGDVFEMREVLESTAARLAAERADEDAVRALRELVATGSRAADTRETDALVDLNSDFHRTIAAASGNTLLRESLERLDKHVRWVFSTVAVKRSLDSWHEHGAIVDAIAARDPDRAAALSAEHSRRTRAAYLDELLTGRKR